MQPESEAERAAAAVRHSTANHQAAWVDPPPQAGPGRRLGPYIWTSVLALVVLCLVAAHAPVAGEPIALRWLRTCAEQPLRTVAALVLGVAALAPRRPLP